MVEIRMIDMHSHWSTRRGYALRTDEERALQEATWRSEAHFRSEEEMADDIRSAGVRAILDFGFTRKLPIDQVEALHDYAFDFQRANADCIIGNWLHLNPRLGQPSLREFRRCLDGKAGFVGLAVSGSGGAPATDPAWLPFYKLCIEANVPALIFVGHTGSGSGLPGGGGIVLDDCHPRHLDRVAAENPELSILAARPAWPWQTEMLSVLLHKPNVHCELHGWSPKYFAADLRHEMARRLRKKFMFGADYPLFTYERLEREWRDLGFSDEVMQDLFTDNATRYLAQFGS